MNFDKQIFTSGAHQYFKYFLPLKHYITTELLIFSILYSSKTRKCVNISYIFQKRLMGTYACYCLHKPLNNVSFQSF